MVSAAESHRVVTPAEARVVAAEVPAARALTLICRGPRSRTSAFEFLDFKLCLSLNIFVFVYFLCSFGL